jgi:hypothetical protein
VTTSRLARLCCVLGGLAQLVTGGLAAVIPALGLDSAPVLAWSALLVVVHLTRVVGVLGLAWSGRIGPGGPARFGLGTAVVGTAIYVPAEVLYATAPGLRSMLDAVAYPLATVLAGLGLLIVGVAVLRGREWTGPGRFTPLLAGAYVFAVLLPLLMAGPTVGVLAIGGWGACWILLGLALETPARVPAGAR